MDKTKIIYTESGLCYDWKAIAANPHANHRPQMDLVAYKAQYINSIAQARACGQEPILISLPIMDEDRYFAFITHGMTLQERKNILYWLGGSTVRLRNIHALYNLSLFRIASSHCVHIIDVTSPMLSRLNHLELLEMDGISLSELGRSVVDAEIKRTIALNGRTSSPSSKL